MSVEETGIDDSGSTKVGDIFWGIGIIPESGASDVVATLSGSYGGCIIMTGLESSIASGCNGKGATSAADATRSGIASTLADSEIAAGAGWRDSATNSSAVIGAGRAVTAGIAGIADSSEPGWICRWPDAAGSWSTTTDRRPILYTENDEPPRRPPTIPRHQIAGALIGADIADSADIALSAGCAVPGVIVQAGRARGRNDCAARFTGR